MKTFYNLLLNTSLSTLTTMTVWFALTFFVYLETKSVFATSLISGFYLIITAATGIYLGSLVDHYSKKKLLIISGLISTFFFIAAWILYNTVDRRVFNSTDNPALWALIIICLLGVLTVNLRAIILPTLITVLVEEKSRDKANGLAGVFNGVTFMLVSVISGFLVAWNGMQAALILGVSVNVLSVLHVLTLKIPENKAIEALEGSQKSHSEVVENIQNNDPSSINDLQTGIPEPTSVNLKLDFRQTFQTVAAIPGLLALILFTCFNNFLGGVFMSLMDAYGLSLVSVEIWGTLWGVLSLGFIVGGIVISKWGLGSNPVRSMLLANSVIWFISCIFTLRSNIWLLGIGCFIYMAVMPYIEAAEHTVIQKVVPPDRQGRVFGFAQSIEQSASPFTAFLIGPLAQFWFIPLMSEGGVGANAIGFWFGVGPERGLALVFTISGIIGLAVTTLAFRSKQYSYLTDYFQRKET